MKLIRLLLLFILTSIGVNSYSSHLAGGNITYEHVSGNLFQVNLNLYRDCSGIDMTSSVIMDITSSCGTSTLTVYLTNPGGTEVSQLCSELSDSSTCNGGTYPGIQLYTYSNTVELTPCSDWNLSYALCCRNDAVNASLTSSEDYYIETYLDNISAPSNNSPFTTINQIPYVCVNQPIIFNLGFNDLEGDSLVYSLVDPIGSLGVPLTFNAGYTATTPIEMTVFNQNTGDISFTATNIGNYIVAVLVEEYDDSGILIGSIVHDFQFVVYNCSGNTVPTAPTSVGSFTGNATQTGPFSFELCQGNELCFDIVYSDSDPSDSMSVTSNISSILPGATLSISGTNPLTATVCWTAVQGVDPTRILTLVASDNICPITADIATSIEITVLEETYAGDEIITCGDQTAQLLAVGGSNFIWSSISGDPINIGTNFSCNNCENPIASPTVTSSYEVTSTIGTGCNNKDTVTVFVVPDFNYTITSSDSAVCLYEEVELIATGSLPGSYNYSWLPSSLYSSPYDSITTATASSQLVSDFVLHITSPDGCLKKDTVSITTSPYSHPNVSILASDTLLCISGLVDLQAQLGNGSSSSACGIASSNCVGTTTGNIGTGTLTNTSTAYPAPFGNFYVSSRNQMLYTASELNAMGFSAGKISSIAFDVTTINGATLYENVEIKLGCTSSSSLSAWETNLTTVFPSQNYTISTGWNTFSFANDYEWDGVSNLIVDICHDNNSTTYTNNSSSKYTTTTFSSALYARNDASNMCGTATTPTISSNRPNIQFEYCNGAISSNGIYTYAWFPSTGLNDTTITTPQAFVSATMNYSVIVTDTLGGCIDTAYITIDTTSTSLDPSFNYTSSSYCLNVTDPLPSSIATPGGVFSDNSSNIVVNPTTGAIDLSLSVAGTYDIEYTTTSVCIVSHIESVTLVNIDNASISYPSATYCSYNSDPVASVALTGGVFSASPSIGINSSTGEIDLSSGVEGTTYTVSYLTNGACPATGQTTLTVNIRDNGSFSYGGSNICLSDSIDPINIVTPGGSFYTNSGTLGVNSTTGLIDDQTIITDTPYQIFYVTNGANCVDTTSQTVTIREIPQSPTVTSTDFEFCADQNPPLQTVNSNGGLIIWKNANEDTLAIDTSSYFPVSDGLIYVYELSNYNCQSPAELITIIKNLLPIADAGEDAESCPNFEVQLLGGGADSYLWTPDTFLSTDTISNPTSIPEETITYTLLVTDKNGCQNTDDMTIFVSESNCEFHVYNAFTPNNDSYNDTWTIQGIEQRPDNSVKIYNRWGAQIWEGENYDNLNVVWNGTNTNGDNVPAGVYYYIIETSTDTFSGYIELSR